MNLSERIHVLRDARMDLRYLLDRGYSKSSALRLVGDHYQLDKRERSILYRSVYSRREVEIIRGKRISPPELKGCEVWIDGFNVLNTVEAILRGEILMLCDDGVLRDFSEVHGKYKITDYTWKAVEAILKALKTLKVSRADFLLESQISRSGEIAANIRRKMRVGGLNGVARTIKSVDSEIIRKGGIIATSDSAVLLRCQRFVDLPAYIAETLRDVKILKLQ